MRRWALRIFLFLVLGAIVNVAVACWFAWRCDDLIEQRVRSLNDSEWSSLERLGWYPFDNPQRFSYVEKRYQYCNLGYVIAAVYGREGYPIQTATAGWPTRAVTGSSELTQARWEAKPQVSTADHQWRWSIPARRTISTSPLTVVWRIDRILPLRPIWPGFAINTVFYAVVLWLLFAGPFVVRRWRRLRRGLCPKCAYDLRGTPEGATACPECGAARPDA